MTTITDRAIAAVDNEIQRRGRPGAVREDAAAREQRWTMERQCRDWIHTYLGAEPEEIFVTKGGRRVIAQLEDDILLVWTDDVRRYQQDDEEPDLPNRLYLPEVRCWYIRLDEHVHRNPGSPVAGLGPGGWQTAAINVSPAQRIETLVDLGAILKREQSEGS
jgi:hypothetical protein